MPRLHLALVLALLSLVLLTRLPFAFRAAEGQVAYPLVDDAFYNLVVARNLAEGRGRTFDGTGETTGFHPVPVALMLPLCRMAGGDRVLPLRGVMLLWALAGTALGALVWALARRLAGPAGGLAALFLYATSAYFHQSTLNGCDTVFAGLAFAGTLLFWLARVRERPEAGARDGAVLGALAGLTVLCRLDHGILLVFLALDLLLRRPRRRAAFLGAAAALAVLVPLPWLGFNLAVGGSPLPDNGRAINLISRGIAGLTLEAKRIGFLSLFRDQRLLEAEAAAHPLPGDEVPIGFGVGNLIHSSLILLNELPVTAPLVRVGGLVSHWVSPFPFAAALLGLALLWRLGPLARAWREQRAGRLGFLLAACPMLVGVYCFVVFGQWFFGRYYFPVYLVSLLLAPLLARAFPRWLVAAFALLCVIDFGWVHLRAVLAAEGTNFYQLAREVRARLPADARVGAIQAGTLAWFCPQPIVNLDGKVSPGAWRALKERRMLGYARAQGVRFLVDWPSMLRLLVFERSPPEDRALVEQAQAGLLHEFDVWVVR